MQNYRELRLGRHAVATVTCGVVLLSCSLADLFAQQQPVRFEAEAVTQPIDAWQTNRFSDHKWNLWSTDKDADKKWSGGVVLQSPRVEQDRNSPAEGAPPLHTVIRDLAPGKYYAELGGVSRPVGVSFDGHTWQKLESSRGNLGLVEVGERGFELWVDDRYASATNPGSCYYDFIEFTPLPDPKRKPKVVGYAKTRVTERLNRGLIAMSAGEGRVYLGWRLLNEDAKSVGFNVYRQTEGGSPIKLNDSPLTTTTDFIDERPVAGRENQYTVVAVLDGKELDRSEAVAATAASKPQHHLTIKLAGDHTFSKCGLADLDGDGSFDFVIKQPGGNIDPYEKYWKPSSATFKVEAYLADGTFLWRHDLGWGIEHGIWYSPMIVYDLDGDGKAEVCLKAGPDDRRDVDGRVFSGPEYLVVLDGMTGKERARVDWIPREHFPEYNRASRNQMCVAYLDGKTPCLLIERGTYDTMHVHAFEFRDEQLNLLWNWNDAEEGGGRYRGQGAHSMHAVDIDHDGRDEVFLGSSVLDDNGVGLWSVGLGHPDHHYVGDIDPAHPGLEVYYGVETRQEKNGCCLVDAATGTILWGLDFPTRHVHSSGMCADLDPAVPGWECYSSDTDRDKRSEKRWLFDTRGKMLRTDLDWGFGLPTIYWDADPQREIIGSGAILKYTGGKFPIGATGSIVGFADILGDWREEFITSVDGELRIYTTTIPAQDRRVCLMQDPIYRLDVCIQAMGYTQSPMVSAKAGL